MHTLPVVVQHVQPWLHIMQVAMGMQGNGRAPGPAHLLAVVQSAYIPLPLPKLLFTRCLGCRNDVWSMWRMIMSVKIHTRTDALSPISMNANSIKRAFNSLRACLFLKVADRRSAAWPSMYLQKCCAGTYCTAVPVRPWLQQTKLHNCVTWSRTKRTHFIANER